jgi:type II secretory pathway pseudopilin PulG
VKKKNKNGFFLSETMVVIAIVAIVLLSVFKIFSSVYTKYKESENYNTINATNTAVQLKKYYQSVGFDYATLLGSNYYVDLTNSATYDSEHYDNLKTTLKVDKVYLVNMAQVYTGTNINVFNTSLRKYLKTLQNSDATVSLITISDGSEYGSVTVVTEATVTLTGDVNNEYEVVVPLGGTFVDTGYTNWSGNPPTTTWETAFDNTKEGTYYLKYSFDGFILRRRVVVAKIESEYTYTGGMQSLIVPYTGYYKLEAWGAQGGTSLWYKNGGYGGYSTGIVLLNKNDLLYIYVGGQGSGGCQATACAGGYNGGGTGGNNTADTSNYQSGGGGATHIAKVSGTLSTLSSSLSSILIVAGGGGGGYYHTNGDNYSISGASGGGYQGTNGTTCVYGSLAATGGTQSAGGTAGYRGANGSFGLGGTGPGGNSQTLNGSSGGGGGLYGGGAAGHSGAGGGSGYIANALLLSRGSVTKSMYCYNCPTSATASTLTYSTSNALLTPTSKIPKIGNGYAKITYFSYN